MTGSDTPRPDRIAPLVLLSNLCLAAAVGIGLLSNRQLMLHGYVLYGFQMITLLPCVFSRARWLSDAFLPSSFVLVYFLTSLALGAFLVPRGFGWNKEFAAAAYQVQHFPLITSYLMVCNVTLAWLSMNRQSDLGRPPTDRLSVDERLPFDSSNYLWRSALFMLLFFGISIADVYSAFSFQLGIILLHLADPSLRSRRLRFPTYLFYIGMIVAFSFDNKREVAMTLFAIIFIECYFSNIRLRFSLKNVLAYVALLSIFMILIVTASVLRGYGDYIAATPLDLITMVPGYIGSDIFADGITDNLELNYNYGVTITSMDYALRGIIDFQLGASIIKPLFLPFPRELFDWKPESVLQVFTRAYAPDWWAEGGSMPVSLPAEMFVNFHVAGIIAFAAIINLLNGLYVRFPPSVRHLSGYSSMFLALTVLMPARGSGLEQYLLYYGVSLGVFFTFSAMTYASRIGCTPRSIRQ